MKTVKMHIEGSTPYSPSKFIDIVKKAKDTAADHEEKVWRERCHYDPSSKECYIPAIAFAKAIQGAAQYLPIKIPGKMNATYTKHFRAGLYVPKNLPLGVKFDDVEGEWLMVPSNGKPGGGSRVKKCFPIFRKWSGVIEVTVLDDTITEKIFEQTAQTAAAFIGIGRFRPEKGGWNGRFEINKFEWS